MKNSKMHVKYYVLDFELIVLMFLVALDEQMNARSKAIGYVGFSFILVMRLIFPLFLLLEDILVNRKIIKL